MIKQTISMFSKKNPKITYWIFFTLRVRLTLQFHRQKVRFKPNRRTLIV
jgi:hypothetical protein